MNQFDGNVEMEQKYISDARKAFNKLVSIYRSKGEDSHYYSFIEGAFQGLIDTSEEIKLQNSLEHRDTSVLDDHTEY